MSVVIKKRYEITKLLGKGGMANVYLAWDKILNREVAIKILKSDMSDDDIALERFKREAGATTQLSHPNIVDVYDVGDEDDKHFIVMEYIKGYTLKQLIKKRGAIPYKEAVWMIKQLASALMEAHRNGIVHRDVKSQNVLIKPDGTIKLSDFGIALSQDAMQITHKDSILGSVHYLAPEISRGRQASMQSDIYSLGIVLYEMLTGDVPFKGETPVQVALKHVKENIVDVRSINRDIPQSVDNIIIKATAKSLANRYKNIALMIQDLNVCLKPEHLNDPRVELDTFKEDTVKKTVQLADEEEHPQTKKKNHTKLYIGLASALGIVSAIVILFLTGIIGPSKNTEIVPDLTKMTVLEAKDTLAKIKLDIDDSHIDFVPSDSIEKDLIISTNPEKNTEVEIGTKIKVVVSSGIYSSLDNYVGKDYKEAKKILEEKNFIVRLRPVESDKKPGIVIAQSLSEGYQYNPDINNEIELQYSLDNSIIIEVQPGIKIKKAKEYFEENNIKYELCEEEHSFFKKDELKDTKPNTLIKTDPAIGSSYTIDSDVVVKAYYYTEEIIDEEDENKVDEDIDLEEE